MAKGNYSLEGHYYPGSTFNPEKNYVGVRLQQGVPLLDTDWNELNDVIRNEIYDGLKLSFRDGISGDTNNLMLQVRNEVGDLLISPGTALIQGYPVKILETLSYSRQPWVDPNRADKDEVPTIPSLRNLLMKYSSFLVYLDVWEREVTSKDSDTNIINDRIGVETCVRLKREVAIRILGDETEFPTQKEMRQRLEVGDDHIFMPLYLLRKAGGRIHTPSILDLRPRVGVKSVKENHKFSIAPYFFPVENIDSWSCSPVYAHKSLDKSVGGLIPISLPNKVTLSSISLRGYTRISEDFDETQNSFLIYFDLVRIQNRKVSISQDEEGNTVVDDSSCMDHLILPSDPETSPGYFIGPRRETSNFDPFHAVADIATDNQENIIDNEKYSYVLYAYSLGLQHESFITEILFFYISDS
jgi:hypothetical protein